MELKVGLEIWNGVLGMVGGTGEMAWTWQAKFSVVYKVACIDRQRKILRS